MPKKSDAASDIVIYESKDGLIKIDVSIENETVWLSAPQMAELFLRDVTSIRKHIKNVYDEGELTQEATSANFALVQ